MGMFDQIKDVMKMRSEGKRIQSEMQKISAEYSNGGITAVVKGDMTVEAIRFAPDAFDEVKAGKSARFETMLLNVVNGAIKKAKEATQAEMMRLVNSGAAGGLFGK